MSGPAARVTDLTATTFTVTISSVTGTAGTTARLQTRTLGSSADWTTKASDATPAVDDTLQATSLTEGTSLEWRVIEEEGDGTIHDGTHGIVTPASSPWDTLTSTVSTALQGQSLSSSAIQIGRQPPPNYADVVAVIRTLEERVDRRANNVERVVFPVEVEFRITKVDDDGSGHKTEVERWQDRLRTALHEKHPTDFPSIAGLEEIRVEIVSKDDRKSAADEYEDEVRSRARVNFAIWRNK